MDRLLKAERLPSMKLALSLSTVEVVTEEDVETGAAECATNFRTNSYFWRSEYMIAYQKEAILISFLNEKERYKKLAEYIVHLIRDDPSSPKESLHTIVYRIKDELRIIEKIDKQNRELEAGAPPITEKNYRTRVGDLLGVRIICLRLSDIVKIEAYLGLLSEERILRFVKGPDQKRSFILPVDPGESISDGMDLTYSGYSSIH
jgi:hypothetical protein